MTRSSIAYVGAAGDDRLGEQDREEQRRLPEVATLALPEQERGVPGDPAARSATGRPAPADGPPAPATPNSPHAATSAANAPRIQAPRTSHDDVFDLVRM